MTPYLHFLSKKDYEFTLADIFYELSQYQGPCCSAQPKSAVAYESGIVNVRSTARKKLLAIASYLVLANGLL